MPFFSTLPDAPFRLASACPRRDENADLCPEDSAMPLLDHFHPPLADARHWESFHGAWAYEMMGTLNRGVLPPGYFAEAQVHVGLVEVDVPTFAEDNASAWPAGNGGVAVKTWAPPATALVMPAVFPDEIELRVFRQEGGATLVAAVELVSPSNKDRPETRRLFAAKCASYLQARIGLVVIDVVTERSGNMHHELLDLLRQSAAFRLDPEPSLYTVAYRPSRTATGEQIEIWPTALAIGQPLPTMPLALRDGPTVPLELESAYMEARQHSRL
jgi:hypothetical protein